MDDTKYQHIGLIIIDEQKQLVSRYEGNFADIYNFLDEDTLAKPEFILLSGINPYGDTYFNYLQAPTLNKELLLVSENNNDKTLNEEIVKTIDFLKKVESRQNAQFIGD